MDTILAFSSLFYIHLFKRSNLFHFVTLCDKLFGQYFYLAFLKVGRPLLKGRLQIKYSFFLTLSGIWVGHGVNVGSASTRFGCTVGISIVVIRPTQQLWSN